MKFHTKQDQVADLLRERIITGIYSRGQRLKQLEVAADLGLSVTPVREALRILEAEGYVSCLSHKGALIPLLDGKQAQEIFELRIMLERELTRLALGNVTRDVLGDLHSLQQECIEAATRDDQVRVRQANYRFHFRLYELAERPQTLQFVRVLWAKYPFHGLDAVPRRNDRMIAEHNAFLARVAENDHAEAVEAMERHVREGWLEFFNSSRDDNRSS